MYVSMFMVINTYAIPADPEPKEFYQADGTMITAYIHGDEIFNWVEDENEYIIAYNCQDENWYYAQIENNRIVPGVEIIGEETGLYAPSNSRITRGDLQYLIEDSIENNTYSDMGTEDDLLSEQSLSSSVSPKTNQELLLLLIEFNDVSLQRSDNYWSNQYFTGDKSVAGYYRDMSNGLDVFVPATTKNIGLSSAVQSNVIYQGSDSVIKDISWVKGGVDVTVSSTCDGVIKVVFDMPHPIPRYSSDSSMYSRAMITMALKAIKENTNYNFSGFGVNKQVAAVVAGGEAASGYVPSTGGQVWAHKWVFDSSVIGLSGYRVYMHHGEMYNATSTMGIGVSCHELGHTLGLPDLYNTLSSGGIGYYSLMASGSWGALLGENGGTTPVSLDAWSKSKLGYSNPIIYEASDYDIIEMKSMGTIGNGSNSQYNSLYLGNSDIDANQYFLIDNRQNQGWDAGMQRAFKTSSFQGGILIMQIDENVSGNTNNNHRQVDIVGSNASATGNYFYAVNRSNRNMTPSTNPSSNFRSVVGVLPRARDVISDINVKVKSNCSDTMEVEIGVDSDITDEIVDNNFLQAVRNLTGKADNDSIYRSDVRNITELDISNKNIRSLKGIEYFTNLKEFFGYFNYFTILDFSNNKNLEVLDCSYNPLLTELDLSENRKLRELYCEYSSLTSLKPLNSNDLITIVCYENELQEIDVSNNINLEELYCWKNNLTSIDVTNNVNLTYLDCSYNKMSSINDIIGWRDKQLTLGDTFIFNPQKNVN
jgi:M6 family metalloprotease-like protein